MAVIIWTDIEHNKQEDNLLQQVICVSKEVIKHRPETKIHKIVNYP